MPPTPLIPRISENQYRTFTVALKRILGASALLLVGLAGAQPNPAYAPPAGYYLGTAGLTGTALKSALHQIIKNHTVIPYSSTSTDVWDALMVLDEDPANPANVLLVYNGVSWPKSDTNGDGNTTTTTASWEREHCWPQSFGIFDNGPDTSDLFNLRACRRSVNASRSNRYYQQANTSNPADPAVAPPNCPECLYDHNNGQGGIWTPRPSEKGDLARTIFYMAVRYDGSDPGTMDLEPGETPNATLGKFGVLSTLLAWNAQDPVSETERRRNQLIYANYQHNRNPFIDHPEMVSSTFGSVPEQPALVLTVTPSAVNEGSSAIGAVTISSSAGSPLTVTLAKSGDPGNTEISVPASVVIPAGATSVSFNVSALTDGVVDGDKGVSILADAAGYQSGLASVTVIDVDVNPDGPANAIVGTGSYNQGFDSLPATGSATWTDNTTIPGWYAQRTGNGTAIVASTGSSTSGALYSFGTTAGDRALGSLGSSNAAAGSFAWGVTFRNSTNQTATLGTLSYTGEQWRNGGAGAAQTLAFSYQTGTSAVASLTPAGDTGWTAVNALDFTSPVDTTAAGLLDGNAAANRSAIAVNLNMALAPGQWITFRWRDIDHAGSDDGLAIDDFRLDWSVPVAPAITSPLAAAGKAGTPFSYSITANNSPQFYEAESLPDGLSINGTTGEISGVPQQAGQFDVTILVGNDAGTDIETLTLTVAPPDMSFAGWSGGMALTPELLQAYAIGGASHPGGDSVKPTVAKVDDLLILTAVVRTDDPGLRVMGEAAADLVSFGGLNGVTEVNGSAAGVDQTGVPVGCERQEFRIATNGSTGYFMRLRIRMNP